MKLKEFKEYINKLPNELDDIDVKVFNGEGELSDEQYCVLEDLRNMRIDYEGRFIKKLFMCGFEIKVKNNGS
ncbi:MAG: hypothetical protein GY870_08245 [archaeon]|nr:hypothetical protein [archaeon]